MIMVDEKVAWAEATVLVLASIFGVVRIVTAIPRVRKILVNAKGLGLKNFGLKKSLSHRHSLGEKDTCQCKRSCVHARERDISVSKICRKFWWCRSQEHVTLSSLG